MEWRLLNSKNITRKNRLCSIFCWKKRWFLLDLAIFGRRGRSAFWRGKHRQSARDRCLVCITACHDRVGISSWSVTGLWYLPIRCVSLHPRVELNWWQQWVHKGRYINWAGQKLQLDYNRDFNAFPTKGCTRWMKCYDLNGWLIDWLFENPDVAGWFKAQIIAQWI